MPAQKGGREGESAWATNNRTHPGRPRARTDGRSVGWRPSVEKINEGWRAGARSRTGRHGRSAAWACVRACVRACVEAAGRGRRREERRRRRRRRQQRRARGRRLLIQASLATVYSTPHHTITPPTREDAPTTTTTTLPDTRHISHAGMSTTASAPGDRASAIAGKGPAAPEILWAQRSSDDEADKVSLTSRGAVYIYIYRYIYVYTCMCACVPC